MTFRLKTTLCMVGLLCVLFGVGASLLIAISFQDSLEREQEALHGAYQMVLGTLQIVDSVHGYLDDEDIAGTLEQISEQSGGSWTALRVSIGEHAVFEHNASYLVDLAAPPNETTSAIGYRKLDANTHAVVLSGVFEAGGETLDVAMSRDVTALIEARDAQLSTYLRVFFLMAALCAFLSYTVAGKLTKPLVSLSRASKAIAGGDLSTRVDIGTRDEIGLVAHDFNAMGATLEQTVSELEEAARRQDRFVGSFAHEIKTPMTSIIGYADLLRGQSLSEGEQAEAAHYIVSEGKRLENLSQKLLSLLVLKDGPLALAPAHPKAVIEGLAARMKPLYAQRGITMRCDCEAGRCLVDVDLLTSLLVNLWDNAAKAMDGKGGTLYVRCDMLSDGCRIAVKDEGCGIPPEALDRLTEAFYRVDASRARSQGGAGLGLSLCNEIAARHNGSLRFESRVGSGTVAIVELRGGAA